ncbi:MAG: glycosyltransferase [Anaerolineales bacterium]|nr:glycosyltransferase [Anaerolineales bacterium]
MRASLAIVVVTHNRRESLLGTLEKLHELEAAYQVVVVDNASTDGTVTAVQQHFPQVQVVPRSTNIGAVARNDGVRMVRQPYVAFADDDSWWARGALSRAVTIFETHSRLGLIMSRILVGPEERLDPCCELMSRTPLERPLGLPGFPILGFVACGAIVRRSAFVGVNGFHDLFGTSGEEGMLAIELARQGWRLAYVPEVVSHHYPSKMRSMHGRYVDGVCHELWTTWLRRSPRRVMQLTLKITRDAFHDSTARRGLLAACRGLPWVVKDRAAVPPAIEQQLVLLEKQLQEE